MDMFILLLLLIALIWFWSDSLNALELARLQGKKVCSEANLQFLDDTVENIKTRLARNEEGRRVLQRTYRFQFSETGNSRLEGLLVLSGNKVESLILEPYQMML